MKLVVISHHEVFAETPQSEALIINSLFEAGLEKLHIRKPTFTEFQTESLIQLIDPNFYSSLTLHSHHHLVEKYSLGGYHYKDPDFKVLCEKTNRESASKENLKTLSASFHSTLDLIEYRSLIDYSFLSPIFNSISDPKKKQSFSEEALLEVKPELRNTFALGGVGPSNIKKVKKLGFSGAALKGYIWNSNSPLENFIKAKELCQ